MTKDEALRLALEALEDIGDEWGFTSQRTVPKRKEAITAIKEALAQTEQEQFALKHRIAELEGAVIGLQAQLEQDGKCKHCTDGCPACDARKLPEQEPVAWGVFEGNLHDMFFSQEEAQEMADLKGTHAEVRPLYTTPPQRTWVGLTRIELIKCGVLPYGMSYELYEAIDQALKDKNT
jgi:hypothetical protein